MKEEVSDIYFSIRNGEKRQVSKEEWEREWLRWWNKNSSKREEETAVKPG
jgi:hypothetical protein